MKTVTEGERPAHGTEFASELILGVGVLGVLTGALIGLNTLTDPSASIIAPWPTIETALRDLVEMPYNIALLVRDIYQTGVEKSTFYTRTNYDIYKQGFQHLFQQESKSALTVLSEYLNHQRTFLGFGQEHFSTTIPTFVGGAIHGVIGWVGSMVALRNRTSKQIQRSDY